VVRRCASIQTNRRLPSLQRIQIRFNTTVDRIDRADDGWQITTNAETHHAPDVVVATGLDRVASTPDWKGRSGFSKAIVHVAELSRAADLSGQHVLLAGAGNSGVDIAAHLVDAGVASLCLSVRTPPNIVPAEIHRVPLQAAALAARPLPERFRDGIARHGRAPRNPRRTRTPPTTTSPHLARARDAFHRRPCRHRRQPSPTLNRRPPDRTRHRPPKPARPPNVGIVARQIEYRLRMCGPVNGPTISTSNEMHARSEVLS
jgi:cation diffusion facilitator CzcD-associated flavoprotein CzcO